MAMDVVPESTRWSRAAPPQTELPSRELPSARELPPARARRAITPQLQKEMAAIKMQAAFRGMRARLRVRQKRKRFIRQQNNAGGVDDGSAASGGDDASRLIFFENLFFELDEDGSDHVTFDEMRRLLSFMAIGLTTAARETHLRRADSENADGLLSRFE